MPTQSTSNICGGSMFITCGTIILCTNNQHGVDIILPACLSGKILSHENVTAILIQVKNNTTFNEKVWGWLFNAMDPFNINVFSQGDAPRPVIRMVFALASRESATKLTLPHHSTRTRASKRRQLHKSTAYDIWCAGLSLHTFPCISGEPQLDAYRHPLHRTRYPTSKQYDVMTAQNIEYPGKVAKQKETLLRHFNPLLQTQAEHQQSYKGESDSDGPEGAAAA
ncbi:hypothetical protein BJV74DRAFT_859173 [Russula compacta]|nr:hypothetical protein BJV74DRAFT_859173 [Russula compacta]